MRKPLSNPGLFVLVVILAFILLLSIGSTSANASQGETYAQIPQYRWSSFETIAAATILAEYLISPTHPLYMPLIQKDGTAPACERPLTGAAIDGADTGLINTRNMPLPPALHRQTRAPHLRTAGRRNPSAARELPTQPINGMSPAARPSM